MFFVILLLVFLFSKVFMVVVVLVVRVLENEVLMLVYFVLFRLLLYCRLILKFFLLVVVLIFFRLVCWMEFILIFIFFLFSIEQEGEIMVMVLVFRQVLRIGLLLFFQLQEVYLFVVRVLLLVVVVVLIICSVKCDFLREQLVVLYIWDEKMLGQMIFIVVLLWLKCMLIFGMLVEQILFLRFVVSGDMIFVVKWLVLEVQ